MSRSRDVLDEEGLVCVLYVRAEGGPDDVSNCWFYVDSYHPLFVSSITRQSHMLNVRDNAIEANSATEVALRPFGVSEVHVRVLKS